MTTLRKLFCLGFALAILTTVTIAGSTSSPSPVAECSDFGCER